MGTRSGVASGSSGEWGNSAGTTVEQVVAAARTGLYGLRIAPTAATAKQSREFNLSQAWSSRFYFRYPSLPGADSHLHYIGAGGGAETTGVQWRFRSSDGKLIAVALDGAGAVTETEVGPDLDPATWYRLEYIKAQSGALDWQVAVGDGGAEDFGQVGGTSAFNSVFFGTNTSQTFDLHVADMYAAYSEDDGGENGAALVAEGFRGPGYGKRLVAVSASSPDTAPFSMTDASAVLDSWQAMDDDPMIGAPGLRQDSADAAKYVEYELTQLGENETPHAISVVAEGRAVGGGTSNATLKDVKDGAEETIINTNWNNGPQLISTVYLPGDSQTTKWTRAQVNAMKVRWGYSGNVSNPPIIGGFTATADVSTPPPVPSALLEDDYYDELGYVI
jgi:hypothetical protein